MSNRYDRRTVLGGLAGMLGLPAAAAGQTLLQSGAQSGVQSVGIAGLLRRLAPSGKHSVVVVDLASGDILEGANSNLALPPASVTKIPTALYGLNTMGSAHRYQTRILATGPVQNGVLRGDLVLVGGGDPTLDTPRMAALADQLAASGIRTVNGAFRVYSGALPYQRVIDRDQPDHVGYNASISGMNLNFNRVFFKWTRTANGYQTRLSAKSKSIDPVVRGITMTPVARDAPLYTYRSVQGRDRWTVAANKLGRGGTRWLPVRAPANYSAEVLRRLAQERGITLPPVRDAKSIPSGRVIARDRSKEMATLIKDMLKFSNNLTAETVGLSASQKRGRARTLKASARRMSDWIGSQYNINDFRFVDHSGLGEESRISARNMAEIVAREGWDSRLRTLLKPVNLRNSDWKPAPIAGASVVAKTGTLNFVSGLAGYIDCPNGRKLAFAIFTADLPARQAIPRNRRDRATGTKQWARASRVMQHQLIRRWIKTYGTG